MSRNRTLTALLAVAILLTAGIPAARSAEVPVNSWQQKCNALKRADFASDVEAPAKVWGPFTKFVEASDAGPAYCSVQGYVVPNVGFEIRLPAANWNGKFLALGCGADCGFIQAGACKGPLQKGYACIATDTGHRGQGGLWATNDLQAQVDFGYRAIHVVTLAGKAIAQQYYGSAPKKSVFFGCSTGGRQALVEAQRFPWDFDGIIAGAPYINDADSAMNSLWAARSLRGKDGLPLLAGADLKLVHAAAVSKCDLDDGVKDGLIGDPRHCKFDPHELVCKDGKHEQCLTQAQADAVVKVYDGPRNSKGERLYVGGAVRGSELNWLGEDGDDGYIATGGPMAPSESWPAAFFRFMTMPPAGPRWQPGDFDFDRDYRRFGTGTQESLLNAGNPDLRKFKLAGGKLLVYQGWNDISDVPPMTIDYYSTVERTMGGQANTQEFFRLFMIPGMNHCGAGEGPFAVDYLSAMEAWLDQGQAPQMLLGAHIKEPSDGDYTSYAPIMRKFPVSAADRTFTRPLFPFPLIAKYRGSGDPDDAANYRAVEPQ